MVGLTFSAAYQPKLRINQKSGSFQALSQNQ